MGGLGRLGWLEEDRGGQREGREEEGGGGVGGDVGAEGRGGGGRIRGGWRGLRETAGD